MFAIYIIPNLTIGSTIINYFCEFHEIEDILVGGTPSVNGWHVLPSIKTRISKKIYKTTVLTPAQLEIYKKDPEYKIIFIE